MVVIRRKGFIINGEKVKCLLVMDDGKMVDGEAAKGINLAYAESLAYAKAVKKLKKVYGVD